MQGVGFMAMGLIGNGPFPRNLGEVRSPRKLKSKERPRGAGGVSDGKISARSVRQDKVFISVGPSSHSCLKTWVRDPPSPS